MWDDDVQKTLEGYLEDLFIMDTEEQIAIEMCGFDSASRGFYFGGRDSKEDWKEESGKS